MKWSKDMCPNLFISSLDHLLFLLKHNNESFCLLISLRQSKLTSKIKQEDRQENYVETQPEAKGRHEQHFKVILHKV